MKQGKKGLNDKDFSLLFIDFGLSHIVRLSCLMGVRECQDFASVCVCLCVCLSICYQSVNLCNCKWKSIIHSLVRFVCIELVVYRLSLITRYCLMSTVLHPAM